MGGSKNLLRVALAVADARCTPVQRRFATAIAAARDGFSRSLYVLKLQKYDFYIARLAILLRNIRD